MTAEPLLQFPTVSDGQRIGRMADKCFGANVPNSWLLTTLGGDNDFGYDYQVQVETDALVKDSFRVQLKGTTSPALNADGTEFSVLLKVSTANYYARGSEPVLLVLCNLRGALEHPKDAPLHYQWVQDDWRRIVESGVGVDQGSVTFRVPVANRLADSVDLSEDIERFRRVAKVGEQLDITAQRDRPSLSAVERSELVAKAASGFVRRSTALFDALASEPTTSWISAPEGTLQWHLREADTFLRAGNLDDATASVCAAGALLTTAKPLEQADYWNAVGRLRVLVLDDVAARDAFEQACGLSADAPRHLVPWAEAELRLCHQIGAANDFTSALVRLRGAEPSLAGMRVRLMAAEGRYADAMSEAHSMAGLDRIVARAIVFSMQGLNAETIAQCEEGLVHTDLHAQVRVLILILRARARFALALGTRPTEEPTTELPMTGPAGADADLLRATWQDVAAVVTSLRAAGWPRNIELIADVWAATATMLGLQESALPLMEQAASARPTLVLLQTGVESLAAQLGDDRLALLANERQPPGDSKALRRIALLQSAGRHKDCVDAMLAHEATIPPEHPMFAVAMAVAISSAYRILRDDVAARWESQMETRPAHLPHLALARFLRTVSQNVLNRDAALAELEKQYEALGRPHSIAVQLFYTLDPTRASDAERCIGFARQLTSVQLLDTRGALRLSQALTTLGRWEELLALAEDVTRRIEGNDQLQAVGAFALDRLGRTGEARDRLQVLIAKDDPSPLALDTYITIATRSGFADEAVACLERVLVAESRPDKQLNCLRHLFGLVHLSDPTSPRLITIAVEIGRIADQANEMQEGLYLLAMFQATLPADAPVASGTIEEFRQRLQAFVEKFPNSKMLRQGKLPENATPDELFRALREFIGFDEDHAKWKAKIQTELQRGITPVPYAWRPRRILDHVSDLPSLWEASKRSRWEDQQLHLTMTIQEWQPTPLVKLKGQKPILDMISLLVIFDLGLIDALFRIFPKVAIGKATLAELMEFLNPMSGSPFRQKLLALQRSLKEHFSQIEQPGVEPSELKPHPVGRSSEEIVELAKAQRYIVYSDDALFRIYANPPPAAVPAICTLDLLLAIEEAGYLSIQQVAKLIATLCSWRVSIVIQVRHQLALLPDTLGRAASVGEGVEAIRADSLCNEVLSAIWNPAKPYIDLQASGSGLLQGLVADGKSRMESVAALMAYWLGKARLHNGAPNPPQLAAVLLVLSAAHGLASVTEIMSRSLWTVYKSLVEFEHGNRMDDARYKESVVLLARTAAKVDRQLGLLDERSLRRRLGSGMTEKTSDSDLFVASYATELIALNQSAERQR